MLCLFQQLRFLKRNPAQLQQRQVSLYHYEAINVSGQVGEPEKATSTEGQSTTHPVVIFCLSRRDQRTRQKCLTNKAEGQGRPAEERCFIVFCLFQRFYLPKFYILTRNIFLSQLSLLQKIK